MNAAPDYASWSQLPPEAKALFLEAAEQWDDPTRADPLVDRAIDRFPDDREVLVSAYRYYFYRGQPERALPLADRVLDKVRTAASLPAEWADLGPRLAAEKGDPLVRLYLAAYAARGLLLAQLGQYDEAKLISSRVRELDDRREFCAGTVLEVLAGETATG